MEMMIDKMLAHWDTLNYDQLESVYVGRWRDKQRGGNQRYWTVLNAKNRIERINLTFVRIKEEFDFLIMKSSNISRL